MCTHLFLAAYRHLFMFMSAIAKQLITCALSHYHYLRLSIMHEMLLSSACGF